MSLQPVPLKAFVPSEPQRFIQIDEDGSFKLDDLRVSDVEIGRAWMAAIQHNPPDFRVWTHMDEQDVLVEAFDAPYIALLVSRVGTEWRLTMPYGHTEKFTLDSLTLDEWDRFHGLTLRGIPFVFSRQAQASFFDMLDDYDDDSIKSHGETHEMKPWLRGQPTQEFWTERYIANDTPWDNNGPHPALSRLAAAVKLQRSRILVLGCGRGHDAAWLARFGHIVTAVDFSHEAIREAQALYGDVPDLTFVQADAFNLPAKFDNAFDVVFEHTMYCAIDPSKRNDLVKAWRRALVDNGHLLGLFFASERTRGPAYGGSEWELRSRFAKLFRPLYWQRLKDSPESRLGSELFIYSQKLALLR